MSLQTFTTTDNTSELGIFGSYCDHVIVAEDAIEYVDGVFVAYCDKCRDRISMDRVPGGSLTPRVAALKRVVDSGSVLQVHEMEFKVLKVFLRKELDHVRAAAKILAEIEEALE